jgi:hypothetical protein
MQCGGMLLIPILIIASVLTSPPKIEFTRQYYEFGLERIIFLVIVFTVLLCWNTWWGKMLSFAFTLVLFSLSLILKWQIAYYYSTLGGLLPLLDANAYYQGAQSIIYGFDLIGTPSYRPIFTAFLSVIMKALNSNLQETLIALTVLNAVAVYLAAQEVHQSLKSNLAAAIYVIFGYMFFRRFSGTLLTENIGFFLGNMALVFLIRGSANNKLNFVLYGLFLLTAGLNARAGAFLILPSLAVWIGIVFRSVHGIWKSFISALLVICLGMVVNLALVRLINSPTAKAFSNYSYTLYGLASGNKGWEQAIGDHPHASTDEIYALAFKKIRETPRLFVKGVAGAYMDYFESSNGAFSFLLLKSERRDLMNLISWILSIIGLLIAVAKRRQKEYSILFSFFTGIVFSVGFVPPADSTMMRVYAATVPMSIYIIAIGTSLLQKILPETDKTTNIGVDTRVSFGVSIVVLIAIFILPVVVKLNGHPPKSTLSTTCKPDQKAITFSIADGSSIILNHKNGSVYLPYIEFFRLAGTIHMQQMEVEERALIMNMEDGTTITIATALLDNKNSTSPANVFLITKGIPELGVQSLCVERVQLGRFYFASLDSNKTSSISNSLDRPSSNSQQVLQKIGLWLTFIFAMIWVFEVNKFLPSKALFVIFNTVLITSGILLLMHTSGLVPIAWEKKTISPNQIQHLRDHLYIFNLNNSSISDTTFWDFPSYLYEDGVLLAKPHEPLSLIANYGRGSYLFKGQVLSFSTSDNSDPRTNGRQYTIEYPFRIRIRYQILFFIITSVAFLIHLFYFKPLVKQNKP